MFVIIAAAFSMAATFGEQLFSMEATFGEQQADE